MNRFVRNLVMTVLSLALLVALAHGSPALADDSTDAAASAAIASLVGIIWLFVVLLILGLQALKVWIFWQILTKAGFNPVLAFLGLIPAGSLAIVLILAFGRWPLEDELARLRSGVAGPLSTT